MLALMLIYDLDVSCYEDVTLHGKADNFGLTRLIFTLQMNLLGVGLHVTQVYVQ